MNKTFVERSRVNSTKKAIMALYTILDMVEAGEIISYSAVANRAHVSRTMLYSHPELCELIESCRVSRMTKTELQQDVVRLRLRVRELENMLARQIGSNQP